MNAAKYTVACRAALFAGLFSVLCVPLVTFLFRLSSNEGAAMQALAERPKWSPGQAQAYLKGLDRWIDQHYPLRLQVIALNNYIRHRWLRSASQLVVTGSGEWLFYAGNRTFEDFAGLDRLSPQALDKWISALEGRRAWLAARGVRHILVFVPNKSSVYPEYLPAYIRARHRPGKYDQLVERLRETDLGADFIDLREQLLSRKDDARLFWLTDSHWNAEGQVLASERIVERLREIGFARTGAVEGTDYRVYREKRYGDCAGLLAVQDWWPAEEQSLVNMKRDDRLKSSPTPLLDRPSFAYCAPHARPLAFETPGKPGRLVMLCDSFFRVGGLDPDSFACPPLAATAGRFVSVWNWDNTVNCSTKAMMEDILALEKPDAIVEEMTERYLGTPPPDDPEFQAARAARETARQTKAAP